MVAYLESIAGGVLAQAIRFWVRTSGVRTSAQRDPWLTCPMGPPGRIGAEFYPYLANREHLKVCQSATAGLIPDFEALRGPDFDPDLICADVRDFYEHTSGYRLEAWSEAGLLPRVFLWGLTRFVSRRMDQLNFPVSALEMAGGMTSEVLPLVNSEGEVVYTGWLRRLMSNNRVIYTGLYGVEQPPGASGPCIKVSFPLPRGSSTVFLRPEAQPDGSLKLISSGESFGEAGFYRMLEIRRGYWRVRYIRTLRELFHVYVDEEGCLRTEHRVKFLGLTVLKLIYKLEKALKSG